MEKMSLRCFSADQKIMSMCRKCCFGPPIAGAGSSYCQKHTDNGPSKMLLKLALTALQFHCHSLPLWRKYALKAKTAKGLRWCWVKVKGVTNLPEPPSSTLYDIIFALWFLMRVKMLKWVFLVSMTSPWGCSCKKRYASNTTALAGKELKRNCLVQKCFVYFWHSLVLNVFFIFFIFFKTNYLEQKQLF